VWDINCFSLQVLKTKIENESKKENQSGSQGSNGAGPEQDEEERKAAENQIRALKFTMYAMGGIFLGTGLYIFFSYGMWTEKLTSS